MKEITVISGKGGTGKTSVTAALATLASDLVLCDADVDASDLHLILQPQIRDSGIFEGAWIPHINTEACTDCGLCDEYCRFDAISIDADGSREIDPYKCEGCRLCERICPAEAIHSERSINNNWYLSETRAGLMSHARMGAGEENSGKLVTLVRQKARDVAKEQAKDIVLTDGPPGTGCPAIASITGTDAVLLVIEPSASALHDARRVAELARGFKIPAYAIINKWDIHADMSHEISEFLAEARIPLLGKVPFHQAFVEAMIAGQSIVEYAPDSEISRVLQEIWSKLL